MADKSVEFRKLNQKCDELLKQNNFEEVITCYERLFEITKDYHYKQKIANIYYKIDRKIEQAAKIYREITPHLANENYFWWQYFEIKSAQNKTYDAVCCVYNAINIEISARKGNQND